MEEYIKENLRDLAAEILEWKQTALLHGGTGGKLRELANMWIAEHDAIDFGTALSIAETSVLDACAKFVAQSSPTTQDINISSYYKLLGYLRDHEAEYNHVTSSIDEDYTLSEKDAVSLLMAREQNYRNSLRECVTALYEAMEIAPLDRLPTLAGGAIQNAQFVLDNTLKSMGSSHDH